MAFMALLPKCHDALIARPGKNQVLIAVKACGVNFPDVLMLADKYQFKPPLPFPPGGEVAGIVQALGEGVSNLKVGDRVAVSVGNGGVAGGGRAGRPPP